MSPLKTVYRAIVMVATGVIVVKGWQLYGPPTEKVKAFAVEAMEMAQTAWDRTKQQATPPATLADDPRPQGVSLTPGEPSVPGIAAPPFVAGNETVVAPELPKVGNSAITPGGSAPAVAAEADRLPQLLARLEQIGGANPQLGAWGSSGNLYRFSCRAQLANSPAYMRHFEAVAEEPVAAVEQVVTSVEAWRAEQQNLAP